MVDGGLRDGYVVEEREVRIENCGGGCRGYSFLGRVGFWRHIEVGLAIVRVFCEWWGWQLSGLG